MQHRFVLEVTEQDHNGHDLHYVAFNVSSFDDSDIVTAEPVVVSDAPELEDLLIVNEAFGRILYQVRLRRMIADEIEKNSSFPAPKNAKSLHRMEWRRDNDEQNEDEPPF